MPMIKKLFKAFDTEHPQVYSMFKLFAAELRTAGVKRISVDEILHRIRWEMATTLISEIEIDILFSNLYANKLVAEDSNYCGFFESRINPCEVFYGH